jgi:hypothetical protein
VELPALLGAEYIPIQFLQKKILQLQNYNAATKTALLLRNRSASHDPHVKLAAAERALLCLLQTVHVVLHVRHILKEGARRGY